MKTNHKSNVIALYDWEGSFAFPDWLAIAQDLFVRCDVRPDKAKWGTSTDSEKEVSFEHLIEKSCQPSSRESVKVAGAMCTRPGFKQIALGWNAQCSFHDWKNRTSVFCWADSLWALDAQEVEALILAARQSLTGAYGIVYQRDFQKGPDMYAYGMSAGLGYSAVDMREANEIGAWMQERMGDKRYLTGMLRDVYPMNILTQRQLDFKVDNMSLVDWITQESWRGGLTDVSESGGIWIVDSQYLAQVRASLRNRGVLIVG